MKKKIFLIIILSLFMVSNVSAKKSAVEKEIELHRKVRNNKYGITSINDTIVPITLIGTCMIIHNISQNPKKKKRKDKNDYIKYYVDENKKIKKRNIINQLFVRTYSIIKSIFDRILAILGIILLSPLMIIIAIAIKVDSKGPIIYKQKRTGRFGKTFDMYKFRTMVATNDVYDFKKIDKHTKVGNILRKTSLDELPQLFSIASGKMSFVGPRPWIPEYFENMNNIQRHKYDVKPGLTGLAQVKGRNKLTIFEKTNYDLIYIKNFSFIQDIKILFLTIKIVFSAKGADAGKNVIQKELKELKSKNVKKRRKYGKV